MDTEVVRFSDRFVSAVSVSIGFSSCMTPLPLRLLFETEGIGLFVKSVSVVFDSTSVSSTLISLNFLLVFEIKRFSDKLAAVAFCSDTGISFLRMFLFLTDPDKTGSTISWDVSFIGSSFWRMFLLLTGSSKIGSTISSAVSVDGISFLQLVLVLACFSKIGSTVSTAVSSKGISFLRVFLFLTGSSKIGSTVSSDVSGKGISFFLMFLFLIGSTKIGSTVSSGISTFSISDLSCNDSSYFCSSIPERRV